MRYYFNREKISIGLIKDILSLVKDHHMEVSQYKDLEIDPSYGKYFALEEAGALRIFTVRNEGDDLAGYAVFLLKESTHFKNIKEAIQDLLYLTPKARGLRGISFLKKCDEKLKEDGVQLIYHHVTVAKDFSPLLKRQGYSKAGEVWSRRF